MKITKLELKNFKRFDDLTIDLTSLAEPAKLVLLIGTNGSGKSSVFDGFEVINRIIKQDTTIEEEQQILLKNYYSKEINKSYKINLDFDSGNTFSSDRFIVPFKQVPENAFYGRTSIRQIPKLTRTASGQSSVSFEKDSDRPRTFIDRDNRFENDIEKFALSMLTDLYKVISTKQIIENYIRPINKSFENIFGIDQTTSIKLLSIKPPLDSKTAEILFEKGTSTIPYDYLSSGEKEIFNIVLNFLTRREYFQDTIYFLDEIDLHLNTQLQKNLLKEITENWIPDNCQLWTASHSLGFIEYANEAEHAAIIDFDNLNFDVPQVILPSPKNTADIFEIAVSKESLAKLFEGRKIIYSENTDTALYNNLNIVDSIFFTAQNKADVFHKTKNNPTQNGLVDRDYLSDKERAELLMIYNNLYILDYYSIENYLYHPDNLEEYNIKVGKPYNKNAYVESLKNEKAAKRDQILIKFGRARDSYPFYREHENDAKLKALRSNEDQIIELLNSNDLETFYKVFPAKDYGTQIKERQNISRNDLAKTAWFKKKIEEVLQK